MAILLLVLVFVPGLNRVVGGSARWLVLGPLPGVHPAEIAKLAMIVYLAHWMANKGKRIGGFRSGTVPFLIIAVPVIALVFKEPDLGTTVVITLTAFTMFFVAGASLWQLGAMGGIGFLGVLLVGLKDYQIDRIRTFLDPWADPLGTGFHTIQGLLALGLGGILGTGLGESKLAGGLYLPNAWNDFIFAIIGEEFGFVGAGVVIGLFVLLAYAGIRTALACAGHVRGAARGRDHCLAVLPGVHQHRRRRRAAAGHRHHAAVHQRRRLVVADQLRGRRACCCRSRARRSSASRNRRSSPATGSPTRTSPATSADHGGPMRLLIAGGGTGGHIYPALAVANSLRRRPDPVELEWVGGRRGLEATLVPPAGFRLRRLFLRSLRSVERDVHLVLDPIRLALSVPQALWWLARRRPAAIFTTGGYVAIPILVAAAPPRRPIAHVGGQRHPGQERPGHGEARNRAGRVVPGDVRPAPTA